MKKVLIALLFSTTAFAQDITPQQVLERYFEAIGGKANMEKVKDFYAVSSAEVMGQTMETSESKKAPNLYSSVVDQGGVELAKIVFDGKQAKVSQMGSSQVLDETSAKALMTQALIFPETLYFSEEITLTSGENEKHDNEDCYVISISGIPGIQALKEYYSVNSGLKMKQMVEGPAGSANILFKDYKDFEPGVKFPTRVVQEAMGMVIEKKFSSIKINSQIADSEFKIE
ncbi:MAG: hypothetical protein LRY55_00755 [Leadbetterella sp.]|nr:hypothetical protein [Leadbetterella sp.]